jgi:single-strand DNA-binding protein
MNNVNVIGRFTKNPELKYTPNGKPVVSGTLAVQRSFKNPNGEYDADFIPVVIWGKIGETIANKLQKGDRIGGTGRIQTRNFEGQDGKRVYITEVVIDNVTMIDWGAGSNDGGQSRQQNQNQGNQNQGRSYDDPFAGNGQIDIKDDDLPF